MANQNRFPESGLMGMNVQGDLGPITLYTNKHGKVVAYPRSPPKDPASFRQSIQRGRFTAAAWLWQHLTQAERDAWEEASQRSKAQATGLNLFTAMAVQRDQKWVDALERETGITLARRSI